MLHKRSLLLFQLPAARRHFLSALATYLLVVTLCAIAFWPMAHTMRDAVQSARLDARKENSTAALAHLERQIQTIQDAFLYLSSQKGFDRISLDSVYMRLSQNSQPNSDTPDMNSRKER